MRRSARLRGSTPRAARHPQGHHLEEGPGIRLNEHLEAEDGAAVFRHACKLGLEGIVAKRKDSTYRSGRSLDWIKCKNLNCAAVRREAEEDWR